jgi:hypothetical protein
MGFLSFSSNFWKSVNRVVGWTDSDEAPFAEARVLELLADCPEPKGPKPGDYRPEASGS